MPTFYDKLFKPSKRKIKAEWSKKETVNMFERPIPIKDIEAQIINEWFKTNKKSLANQNPKKNEGK